MCKEEKGSHFHLLPYRQTKLEEDCQTHRTDQKTSQSMVVIEDSASRGSPRSSRGSCTRAARRRGGEGTRRGCCERVASGGGTCDKYKEGEESVGHTSLSEMEANSLCEKGWERELKAVAFGAMLKRPELA